MKQFIYLSAYLGIASITGCASIVSGNNQSISISTAPTERATCSLENDKGKWFISQTPGSVTVHRSFRDLQITCKKEGAGKGSMRVKSSTQEIVLGNILIGGVIGAGVDVASGAAYRYPQTIIVPLKNKR